MDSEDWERWRVDTFFYKSLDEILDIDNVITVCYANIIHQQYINTFIVKYITIKRKNNKN